MFHLILIGGCSGSGKTTVANALKTESITLLSLDSFYKSKPSHISAEDYNFDSPEAFDWDLLYECLKKLLWGEACDIPIYSFCIHKRLEETQKIYPTSIIILEGIMVAFDSRVRELTKHIIFVNTDLDECLSRRLERDIKERDRTALDVIRQWRTQVKPAFIKYVKPIKKYPNTIIFENPSKNSMYLDDLHKKIFE